MKNKFLKIFIFAIPVAAGLFISELALKSKLDLKKEDENISVEENNFVVLEQPESVVSKNAPESNVQKNEIIPDKIFIKVPFTSQAPFGKWDERHEEACEEASLVMLKYFLDGKNLGKETAEREIQEMIKFEIKKYGDYRDNDAEEIARLGGDFYGMKNLKVIYDFKKEDFKKYLALGNPIIVPTAGRLLKNPNFTPPGPFYHNLVLIGYEGNIIITNDPGTRKGESYKYDIDILYKAIHDFPGQKEKILEGRKAMIVME